jgi:hypothetical protein
LKANPDVEVQRLRDKYRARVRILLESERSRVWERVSARLQGFDGYQKKTSRVIPLVQLVRVQLSPHPPRRTRELLRNAH